MTVCPLVLPSVRPCVAQYNFPLDEEPQNRPKPLKPPGDWGDMGDFSDFLRFITQIAQIPRGFWGFWGIWGLYIYEFLFASKI